MWVLGRRYDLKPGKGGGKKKKEEREEKRKKKKRKKDDSFLGFLRGHENVFAREKESTTLNRKKNQVGLAFAQFWTGV